LFLPEAKNNASIIGRVCGFDAKIYKILGEYFDVTSCWVRDKKFFKIFDFCFQLPALLIAQISYFSAKEKAGFSRNRPL